MDAREGPLDTRVKDIVQAKDTLTDADGVLTAHPSATVFECIGRMVDHDVGSIVVMDDGAIAGIFTERDYMRSIALEGRSSRETAVREVMEPEVAKVGPEKPLVDCMHLMTKLRCRHLPVVDAEGGLRGIVSIGDCGGCWTRPGRRPTGCSGLYAGDTRVEGPCAWGPARITRRTHHRAKIGELSPRRRIRTRGAHGVCRQRCFRSSPPSVQNVFRPP